MGLKVIFSILSRAFSAKCWNQTKVGLKDHHACEILYEIPHKVEIRPRWDWKCAFGWANYSKVRKLVEIRPRWDWKLPGAPTSRVCILPLLKSDQDGIESSSFTFSPDFSRNSSWNQTKMGLKVCWNTLKTQLSEPLKSDQGGIESRLDSSAPQTRYRQLKSDQGGIERGTVQGPLS